MADSATKTAPRLLTRYREEVLPLLAKEFGITNPMAAPTLDAIVVNVNVGRYLEGGKLSPNIRETVTDTIRTITGQKPITIKARKSVSNFKLREGMDVAFMATMRRERMWHFMDRFVNLATPRIKDFQGLKDTAFDQAGSYSVGITEQGVFPEIDMARVTFTHGMNINFVFTNSSQAISKFVLGQLGMPFVKRDEKAA